MNATLVSAPWCVHTSRMRFHSIGIYNDVSGHSVKRLKPQNKKMIIHALRPQKCAKHRRDASFSVCTATCAITHPMRGAALCVPSLIVYTHAHTLYSQCLVPYNNQLTAIDCHSPPMQGRAVCGVVCGLPGRLQAKEDIIREPIWAQFPR